MEKENLKKPRLEIGIIGHVDHGKTTLTSQLTEQANKLFGLSAKKSYEQIDSALEEKQRGITINTSHVPVETEKRKYTLIDCPGHEDYMKNMIVGASMMNGAIVVISLMDGVKSQTREHLSTAKLIGIKNLIVYLNNKTNKELSEEEQELMESVDIRPTLSEYGYEDVKIIFGSALKAKQGDEKEINTIKTIINELDNFPLPEREENKPFLMYVENRYVIKGIGVVVTGVVKRGKIELAKNNTKLEFFSLHNEKKYSVTVKGMQSFNTFIDEARPGDDVAISLGVKGTDINEEIAKRGSVLAEEGTMNFHEEIEAGVYLLDKEEGGRGKPINNGYKPQIFLHTANITVEINTEGKMLDPKSTEIQKVKIKLGRKFPLLEGDNFIIREGNGARATVGSGFVEKIIK